MPRASSLATGSLTACLLKNEPASYSVWRVKRVEARSSSESESEEGVSAEELPSPDPKPGELSMRRVKRG